MDVGTHALASFALMRATFPRAPRAVWPAVIVAGIGADVDGFSAAFSPAVYLKWHLAFTHSVLAVVILAGLCALLYRVLASSRLEKKSRGTANPGCALYVNATFSTQAETQTMLKTLPSGLFPQPARALRNQFSTARVFCVTLLAASLHLAMDACQSDGVSLFWPFSTRRIAADWLPTLDPIILAVLIAAILLPELLRLVTSEIGAKDKKPRGQTGAIIALSLIAVYVGGRAILHSNAVAALESVTYRGELPRRVAAFPASTSLFTWNGIVETESSLHEIRVNTSSGISLNPNSGVTLHKPEASPVLDSARKASSAEAFLSAARFPKATIEKTESGFRVELRDLRYAASGQSDREILALIELNPAGAIANQELVWARDWKNP